MTVIRIEDLSDLGPLSGESMRDVQGGAVFLSSRQEPRVQVLMDRSGCQLVLSGNLGGSAPSGALGFAVPRQAELPASGFRLTATSGGSLQYGTSEQ